MIDGSVHAGPERGAGAGPRGYSWGRIRAARRRRRGRLPGPVAAGPAQHLGYGLTEVRRSLSPQAVRRQPGPAGARRHRRPTSCRPAPACGPRPSRRTAALVDDFLFVRAPRGRCTCSTRRHRPRPARWRSPSTSWPSWPRCKAPVAVRPVTAVRWVDCHAGPDDVQGRQACGVRSRWPLMVGLGLLAGGCSTLESAADPGANPASPPRLAGRGGGAPASCSTTTWSRRALGDHVRHGRWGAHRPTRTPAR